MEAENEEDQLKCLFLELPGELRNRIYRLCLMAPESVITIKVDAQKVPDTSKGGSCTVWTASLPREPQLLSVCKTIRNEALSIYYGENTLHLRLPTAAEIMSHWPRVGAEYAVRSLAKKLSAAQMKAIGMWRVGKTLQTYDDQRIVFASAAWLTCQLTSQNKIEVTLEQHANDEHGELKRVLCACSLRKMAGSRRSQKNKESVLFDIVRKFTDDYLNEISDYTCKSCGNAMLYRLVD
ncbi:hypothetical protein CB0940_10649 [Cercospora beticola]|uniref:2EXR domain-containing protein n=1 Tax=Cercospora beticola TaxID=122368 RepID=A0A2G5HU38_CERBT|nr:hypothetical protein CB0940_10649 [Cercospora beticola]PIA96050.1 hypothetical protein CB0940_10649 [Cercospora beticola]WPB07377.1 hypothetical protein RHO25_012038 [Cercospora beticola]